MPIAKPNDSVRAIEGGAQNATSSAILVGNHIQDNLDFVVGSFERELWKVGMTDSRKDAWAHIKR